MKKKVLLLLLMTMIVFSASLHALTNHAAHKPVRASSYYPDSDYIAIRAVDNDSTTAWASIGSDIDQDEWIYVDLGKTGLGIDRITVNWASISNGTYYYPEKFLIYSTNTPDDDTSFTDETGVVTNNSLATYNTIDFANPINNRYVIIYCLKKSSLFAGKYYYGITEIEMYNTGEILPTPTPVASLVFSNSDFETGLATNWTITGDLNGNQPTASTRLGTFATQGSYFIGTAEYFDSQSSTYKFNDGFTGEAVSAAFTVSSNYIKLKVGGGSDLENLYVALVDNTSGKILRKATGQNNEMMNYVYWDVREFMGSNVYIKIVDNSTGTAGHINVDCIHTAMVNDIHHVEPEKNLSAAWKTDLTDPGSPKEYTGNELQTIGMPVGGIGAGQLYVRGDGSLGYWWLANEVYNVRGKPTVINPDLGNGYSAGYQNFKPQMPVEQGFAISLKESGVEGEYDVVKLCHDPTEGSESYPLNAITFRGEYPVATINYDGNAIGIPLDVEAEIYAPFIPLNTEDSALPAIYLTYRVTNSSETTMDFSLAGWVQNTVLWGLRDLTHGENLYFKDTHDIVNEIVDISEITGWENVGTILNMGYQQPVPTPHNRRAGSMAFTILNTNENRNNITTSVNWGSESALFQDLMIDGELAAGPASVTKDVGTELVGALCSEVITLGPGVTEEITFILGWFYPNRYQDVTVQFPQHSDIDGEEADLPYTNPGSGLTNEQPAEVRRGNKYASFFDTPDALGVTKYMITDKDTLQANTKLFHDTFFDTTLPYWFIHRVGMPVANLSTALVQWWENGRFWAWEGIGSCYGTCGHVWNYPQALGSLFPELERSVREYQDFNPLDDGAFYESPYAVYDGGIFFRGDKTIIPFIETDDAPTTSMDAQAGYILKAYREHLMTENTSEFLAKTARFGPQDRNYWHYVKRALEFLIHHDKLDSPGKNTADGVIEGDQHNTYDESFYGANPMIGSLYMAALRAGEKMALIMGDNTFAVQCASLYTLGKTKHDTLLFNGEYYIQDLVPQSDPLKNDYQVADGCLSDQLFGQTWSHRLGLGYVFDKTNIGSALDSIYKYNWTTDVAKQNTAFRPLRVYADYSEKGLFNCTWPTSTRVDEAFGLKYVHYKNEVWTGIEYQVASNLIYEDRVEEGLSIMKGVHERYDGRKHNPWNEQEAGDHYARSLASWGTLLAISGYQYDGPAGKIGFAPKLNPDNFKSFFSAAKGWGSISQTQSEFSPNTFIQSDRVEVKYGTLNVRELEFEMPSPPATHLLDLDTITVTESGKAPYTVTASEFDGKKVTIRLKQPQETPITVIAGESINIDIAYQYVVKPPVQ